MTCVPITVVTGFLGSGKTTLVTNLLEDSPPGKRIGVILNEFGDSGDTEKSLIIREDGGQTASEWIELANGCLCCTVKNVGVRTIEGLLEKRQKQGTPLHHVILETSGLADPQPIISMLWTDAGLQSLVCLDSVVCVTSITQDPKLNEDLRLRQLVMSDTILVNKCDLLVSSSMIAEHVARVARINPAARVLHTVKSRVPVELILNVSAYAKPTFTHNILTHHHAQPHAVQTALCTASRELTSSSVYTWLADLLWDRKVCSTTHAMQIWRIKGRLKIRGSKYTHVLQGVQDLFEIVQTQDRTASDSRVLLIGLNLDARALQTSFDLI